METIIRAVLEKWRLLFVSALIKVMSKLVVDGDKVLVLHPNAHLQADIILLVDVPCAGVANNIAVFWFKEERTLPESLWQLGKAQRLEKVFAIVDHAQLVNVFIFEQLRQVIALIAVSRRNQRINIAPLLRPHIAQKLRGNQAIRTLRCLAVFLDELLADVCVQ